VDFEYFCLSHSFSFMCFTVGNFQMILWVFLTVFDWYLNRFGKYQASPSINEIIFHKKYQAPPFGPLLSNFPKSNPIMYETVSGSVIYLHKHHNNLKNDYSNIIIIHFLINSFNSQQQFQ
jgi:hypothetical protein